MEGLPLGDGRTVINFESENTAKNQSIDSKHTCYNHREEALDAQLGMIVHCEKTGISECIAQPKAREKDRYCST